MSEKMQSPTHQPVEPKSDQPNLDEGAPKTTTKQPLIERPYSRPDVLVTVGFVTWMCFVTAACSLLIGFFGLRILTQQYPNLFSLDTGSSAQYVFVDEERLYAMKLKEAIKRPGMSVEKAQEDADAFAKSITTEVTAIAKSGKIVFTKQAVLAGGDLLDVTDKIAANLGLKP